jgi:hypothetical protein
MRKALLLVACLALLGLVPASAQANHRWGKYHWARPDTSTTVDLVYSEGSGVSNWSSSSVRSDWNNFAPLVNGVKAVHISTGSSGVDVTVSAGNYGNNGWVGLAQIAIGSGNHIVSGQIKLNTYYSITSDQRRSTYCMEAGHIFGLDHNNPGRRGGLPDNTCMNDYAWYVSPNSHDTEELAIIYNHGDGYSTFRGVRRQPSALVTIHRTSYAEAAAF